MDSSSIDRRSELTPAEFESEYLRPGRPVILTDALELCPARTRWTPEYFRTVYGDRMVQTDSGEMSIAELIDRIIDPGQPTPFLRERPLPWLLPEILPDLHPFPYAARPNWFEYPFANWPDPTRRGFGAMLVRLAQCDINLTGANIRFPYLHLDRFRCHALIMQWYGRKEFFVFAPEDTPNLYPMPQRDISRIKDVENVDLKRFPRFRKAKMIRFTLHPGEALFNPSSWWHTTRTLDVSIATVISFANASNWHSIVTRMRPPGWKRRLAFVPYATYLHALGVLRLPFWSAPDPSDPATAEAGLAWYEHLLGSRLDNVPQSKY